MIWLIPAPLRKPFQIAWLMALISPVIRLHNELVAFRRAVIYRLTITPQVVYLEKALNDRYDVTLRRIRIVDAEELEGIPVFLKSENKQVVFYRKSEDEARIYYTREESARYGVDFVVEIPVFVSFDLPELTAFLEGFKLASKKFKVKIV